MKFCVTGCTIQGQPVEANHGFLCSNCYDNLRWALQKAPALVAHLREVYVLKTPLELEGAKPQKKEPPAPFNLDAWQIAEEIWIALTNRYIPLNWSSSQVYDEALTRCNEIHRKIDDIANLKQVIYLMPIVKQTRLGLYRYPMEEKARSTLLPCPECNQRTIYQPPMEFGDSLEVKCQNCGFSIPPEKMEFYANLAERERDAHL